MKIYTGGTFDLFHSGHVNFLRHCHKLGDVWVALNTDKFVSDFKQSAPVMTYDERKSVLLACKYVDYVIPNKSGADSKPTINLVRPDIIAIGDDWARKDYFAQMQFTQHWLDENNITLVYIPYTKGISTTEIRKRLLQ